jgi:nucleoside-diphosphate-sugar epimerase
MDHLVNNEADLNELLTRPSERDIEAASRLGGDVLVLGAGGKMGPTLVGRFRRAIKAAGRTYRVIAVVRKNRDYLLSHLSHGRDVIEADLLNPASYESFPKTPNVVFMAGRKFGSAGDQPLTWATNAWMTGLAAYHFHQSRIVAFSTGNVYPFVAGTGPGADEETPVAPVGEYAQSALGRERIFQYFANAYGTKVLIFRLNYAVDLRYGVLVDICEKVARGEAIDLTTGSVNAIWQGDANSYCLRAFALCETPARLLNVTGIETLSVREVALAFGRHLSKTPRFLETEASTALLSDASRCMTELGPPEISAEQLIEMTANWIRAEGVTLGKPTKFERRDGSF